MILLVQFKHRILSQNPNFEVSDFANHFFQLRVSHIKIEIICSLLWFARTTIFYFTGPRSTPVRVFTFFLVRGPLRSAFSKILLVRVRSGPRTGTDRLVRADQLFGPWIPALTFNLPSSQIHFNINCISTLNTSSL